MRLITRFVAAFLRLLYTQLAFAYDLVAWLVSAGHWIEWASTGLTALPSGICLELGHGPGHLLVRPQPGRTLVGIDASQEMAGIAARRQRRAHRPLHSLLARAQALPFRSQIFQGILATFPSEYAFDPRTVAEVYRVLAPSGTWLILPQVHVTGRRPYERLLAWVYRVTGESGILPDAWLEILRRQGFQLEVRQVLLKGAAVQHLAAHKSASPAVRPSEARLECSP